MSSFYSIEDLTNMGFKKIGNNVKISKNSSIYGVENIEIGDNVRIDDFTFLSGKIKLGSFIHISAYSALIGGGAGITMEDFSGLSSKVVIYAVSDDYSGEYLTNPTVPSQYKKVTSESVRIGKHVVIGSGSTVLPGVTLHTGVSVGSMSLITTDLKEWGIYAGIPARYLKNREKNILKLEEKLLNDISL